METKYIIDVINNIQNQYRNYKDGGLTFIEQLAKRVNNTLDNEREDVIAFFLNEISNNEFGFGEIALLTFIEMNAIEVAPNIASIYYEKKDLKDDRWKSSIIEALMKLRYKEPKKLYADYVTSFLIKKPDDAYFLLVQYCNVDPELALPMLSDFYVRNLFRDAEMQSFLESWIGFLFSYFIKNPIDYFPELIKQTTDKDRAVGLHLKELLLEYLSSKMTNQYPKALITERIKALEK